MCHPPPTQTHCQNSPNLRPKTKTRNNDKGVRLRELNYKNQRHVGRR